MCVVVYQWMPANAIQMRATNSNDAKKVNSIIKQKHTNTVNIHVWQDKANNSAYVYVWVDGWMCMAAQNFSIDYYGMHKNKL